MDTQLKKHAAVLIAVVGAVVAVSLAGLRSTPLTMAQGQSVVTAREFRLVDNRGVTRARLSLTPDDDWVRLELNNISGRNQIYFAVSPRGPFALFFDKDSMGSYDTRFQTPSINFVDRNGHIRASLPITQATLAAAPQAPRRTIVGQAPTSGGTRSASSSNTDTMQALSDDVQNLRARVAALEQRFSGR